MLEFRSGQCRRPFLSERIVILLPPSPTTDFSNKRCLCNDDPLAGERAGTCAIIGGYDNSGASDFHLPEPNQLHG
jgi:hypothetical protein